MATVRGVLKDGSCPFRASCISMLCSDFICRQVHGWLLLISARRAYVPRYPSRPLCLCMALNTFMAIFALCIDFELVVHVNCFISVEAGV